jgi:hypothetical protein
MQTTTEEIKRAFANLAWELDWPHFCAALDLRQNNTDAHTTEMWDAFQRLASSLAKFDQATLDRLLDLYRERRD